MFVYGTSAVITIYNNAQYITKTSEQTTTVNDGMFDSAWWSDSTSITFGTLWSFSAKNKQTLKLYSSR